MTLDLTILSDVPKLIAANKNHEEIVATLIAKYNIDQEQAENCYEQVMALKSKYPKRNSHDSMHLSNYWRLIL